MSQRVLVIAAHPDDEALGCGGTLARHAMRGDTVDILFVADGVSSRGADDAALRRRRDAAQRAAKCMGVNAPRFLEFPDNRLDSVPLLDIAQALEKVLGETGPAVVYTHHGGDLNVDHRVVHQAVMTALRPLPRSMTVGIFAFETLSSTEWATGAIGEPFRPNYFVDITQSLEQKTRALACYDEEMRAFPHPRSPEAVQALVRLRGAASGLDAAEAYMTLRWIYR